MVRLDNTEVESKDGKWHFMTNYHTEALVMLVIPITATLTIAGLMSLIFTFLF